MALGSEGEQASAAERSGFQVERPLFLVALAVGHPGVGIVVGGEVLDGQGESPPGGSMCWCTSPSVATSLVRRVS